MLLQPPNQLETLDLPFRCYVLGLPTKAASSHVSNWCLKGRESSGEHHQIVVREALADHMPELPGKSHRVRRATANRRVSEVERARKLIQDSCLGYKIKNVEAKEDKIVFTAGTTHDSFVNHIVDNGLEANH